MVTALRVLRQSYVRLRQERLRQLILMSTLDITPYSVDVDIPSASLDDKPACGRVNLSEKEAGERKCTFDPFECGMSEEEACQGGIKMPKM